MKKIVIWLFLVLNSISFSDDKWNYSGRFTLETEDFDNKSSLRWQRSGNTIGDDEDGIYFGVGLNATKENLSFDIGVEKKYGGDLNFNRSDAEWKGKRTDFKLRYKFLRNQAFHIKYRKESRDRDYTKHSNRDDWNRDRYELGTDWYYFNGKFNGWFVVGVDKDRFSNQDKKIIKDKGWYWEGDFGPSFKLTEKLSFNPTFYITGEKYKTYRMNETQVRIMTPYRITEKLTIMPRIRFTLDRTQDVKINGSYIRDYQNRVGSRVRYELMANYIINERMTAFIGVAFDDNVRDYKNAMKIGGSEGKKKFNMWWSYISITYKFS